MLWFFSSLSIYLVLSEGWILLRWPNHLNWLLPMQRTGTSTSSSHWMSNLLTPSLRVSPNFGHLYLWTHSVSHYSKLMIGAEGWNLDQLGPLYPDSLVSVRRPSYFHLWTTLRHSNSLTRCRDSLPAWSEQQSTIFHGLRIGCADSHHGHLTLCCKPV